MELSLALRKDNIETKLSIFHFEPKKQSYLTYLTELYKAYKVLEYEELREGILPPILGKYTLMIENGRRVFPELRREDPIYYYTLDKNNSYSITLKGLINALLYNEVEQVAKLNKLKGEQSG